MQILDKIFRHLYYIDDRNAVRLVCRLWYHACNLNETAWIKIQGENFPQFIENSLIISSKISFENVSLNELPTIFWQRVGSKIHSLNLVECRLGHEVMKNVILFCDNLKFLRIVLKDHKVDESLCDPFALETVLCDSSALEIVNIVRKQLKSFEIDSSACRSNYKDTEHNFVKWKTLCTTLCKLFPDIIQFTYEHHGLWSNSHPSIIRCTFSSCKTNPSDLGSCLAVFLCTNTQGWREAFGALSLIRFDSHNIPYVLSFEPRSLHCA